MSKKILLISLLILATLLTTTVTSAGLFDSQQQDQGINVTDIKISSEGYGLYDVSCQLTPKKDYKYLQMVVIFYDKDGAVIEKNSLAWNTNDPQKDQLIKVSGDCYVSGSSKPARAEVFFTDESFSTDIKDAIYAENVTMS